MKIFEMYILNYMLQNRNNNVFQYIKRIVYTFFEKYKNTCKHSDVQEYKKWLLLRKQNNFISKWRKVL